MSPNRFGPLALFCFWVLSTFNAISQPLHAAPGELDCRFATGGTFQYDFGSLNPIIEVAQQSDGKIVTLGSGGDLLRLSRFSTPGTLDSTFGTDGTVVHNIVGLSALGTMATDSLDRILVGGYATISGDQEAFVARFTADGAIDSSFGGGDGWVSFDFTAETANQGTESVSAVVLDAADRPIVSGFADANGALLDPSDSNMAVARLDVNGALDPTFGVGGISIASSPGDDTDDILQSLVIDSAGRLVGTGYSGRFPRDTIVARWLSDGTLDTSFGSDGVVIVDMSENGADDFGLDLIVDDVDQVIILGPANAKPALMRLLVDGSLDTTFAGDGILQQSFIGGQDVTSHLLLQDDGKLLVTGWPVAATGFSFDFAVMRFNVDGSRDTTWSSPDGVVTTNFGFPYDPNRQTADRAYAALLLANGRVLLAGSTQTHAAMAQYIDGHENGPETVLTIESHEPNPSAILQPINVSFSVTSAQGNPSGEVTISDGVGECTASVAAGSCEFSTFVAGERTIFAHFPGDGEYCSSSDSVQHFVVSGSQTIFQSLSPSPSVVGEAVTAVVRVASLNGTVGPPTGTVTIDDGAGASCFGTLNNGEMACLITPIASGSRFWSATYGGDVDFIGSDASRFHVVNPAATATEITSATPDPSIAPQEVLVEVEVTVLAPGSGTPSGTVTVDDGAGETCLAPLVAGRGSCHLTPTVLGTRNITASYANNSQFAPSQGTEPHQVVGVDFGDAPSTFPTTIADDGARHILGSGLFLGTTVDSELDGQPSVAALGDDANMDDEDGVAFSGPAVSGGVISVTVQASQAGVLDAWLDFNGDGTWTGLEERIFAGQPLNPGINVLPLALLDDAVADRVVGRFRITSGGVDSADGLAADGEVEDHTLEVKPAEITLSYTATPESAAETGESLSFDVSVENVGDVDLQVTNLDSGTFGDLNGLGDCALPQALDVGAAYSCTFDRTVDGTVGAASDTVVALAPVAGTLRSAEADADFTFTDVEPLITMMIVPDSPTVPEPQGTVTLDLVIQNERNEELILEILNDDAIGDLNGVGTCAVPQTVAPNGAYACSYGALIEGQVGDEVIRSANASVRDDESNIALADAQTTFTVVDGTAPQVSSFSTLDGMAIGDCDTLKIPIEGFLVTFDEAVIGEDQVTSYLVLEAGPDGDFSTVNCAGGVAGDDRALPLAAVSSDGDPETPTATLHLEASAPNGLLGFLVCPQVMDGAGNSIEPALRTFRRDSANRFVNGDFDRCPSTLEPWIVVVQAPNTAQADDGVDVEASTLSGSAQVLSSTIDPTALGQCVDIPEESEFEIRLSSRFEPLMAATATLTVSCEYFAEHQCAGSPSGIHSTALSLDDSAGDWMDLSVLFESPVSIISALCDMSVEADLPEDPAFEAHLDRLFLGLTGVIFRDGFESGDTSGWSEMD